MSFDMTFYTNWRPPEADDYKKKQWRLKRKEILLRDGFECQFCGNSNLIKKSIIGKIVEASNPRIRTFLESCTIGKLVLFISRLGLIKEK